MKFRCLSFEIQMSEFFGNQMSIFKCLNSDVCILEFRCLRFGIHMSEIRVLEFMKFLCLSFASYVGV